MKRVTVFLLLISAGLCSCDKNSSLTPGTDTAIGMPGAPGTGIQREVSGTIDPKGAATAASISTAVNGQTVSYETIPDKDGYFKFTELATGMYTLHLTPASGYTEPTDIQVTIGPDSNKVSLGIIKITKPLEYGSISGTVSPAEAATRVVISYTDGTNTPSMLSVSPDSHTGNFNFTDVPSGSYTMRFTMAKGFISPDDQTVQVIAGGNTRVGNISFTENQLISFLTFKISGAGKTWNRYAVNTTNSVSLAATYDSSELSIIGSHKTGSMHTMGGTDERLTIKLKNVTGPGTYLCNSTETSEIIYNSFSINGKPGFSVRSNLDDGSATVVITAIDPVKKIISGTFSATLKRETYNGGFISSEITDGTFEIPYE